MKTLITHCYKSLLVIILGYYPIQSSLANNSHGLIIAIGNYPQQGGWPTISSLNDVDLMHATLKHLGFEDNNIVIVKDAEASQAGIHLAFDRLLAQAVAGDVVFIHYSGHGQQVADDNGDEIDRLDEAIVPYDSPMRFEAGVYEGERLIRDDYLQKITHQIRRKLGANGQVILILDSCHSGTGTRGLGKARGTTTIMAPNDFEPTSTTDETISFMTTDQQSGLAPMASYFGASPRELNFETLDDQQRPVGSLTFAMSKVLTAMPVPYSFEEVFDRVKSKMRVMAPRQNPQWEGPSNVKILEGDRTISGNKYKIVKWLSPTQLLMTGGTLAGVYEGSRIRILGDHNHIVASGEVLHSGMSSFELTLDDGYSGPQGSWIYGELAEASYPPMSIRIAHDIKVSNGWYPMITYLKSLPIYQQVDQNADIYLTSCDDDSQLQLATKDGTIIALIPANRVDPSQPRSQLRQVLQGYLQAQFIKQYQTDRSKLAFELELLLVDCGTGKILPKPSKELIEIGSCIKVKIHNKGVKGGYFTLLDIQPDYAINIIYPDIANQRTPEEYYLKAGDSYLSDRSFEIAQPEGREVLKLLVAEEPLGIANILVNKERQQRNSGNSSIERWLSNSIGLETRGSMVRKKASEDIATSEVSFLIVPKVSKP